MGRSAEGAPRLERIPLPAQAALFARAALWLTYLGGRLLLLRLWRRLRPRLPLAPGAPPAAPPPDRPLRLVDRSPGRRCYLRIRGIRYEYAEVGPAEGAGEIVILVGGAPCGRSAADAWRATAERLAARGVRSLVFDPADEAFASAGELPVAVDRLVTAFEAALAGGRARIAGVGAGALAAWYACLLRPDLFSAAAFVGAAHPDLFWETLPAAGPLSAGRMHFLAGGGWRWAAEAFGAEALAAEAAEAEALEVRGDRAAWRAAAAWWRGAALHRVAAPPLALPALLVEAAGREAALLRSGERCLRPRLRSLAALHPALPDRSPGLVAVLVDFLSDGKDEITKENAVQKNGRVSSVTNAMGRMFGAVTGGVGAVTSSVRAVATAS